MKTKIIFILLFLFNSSNSIAVNGSSGDKGNGGDPYAFSIIDFIDNLIEVLDPMDEANFKRITGIRKNVFKRRIYKAGILTSCEKLSGPDNRNRIVINNCRGRKKRIVFNREYWFNDLINVEERSRLVLHELLSCARAEKSDQFTKSYRLFKYLKKKKVAFEKLMPEINKQEKICSPEKLETMTGEWKCRKENVQIYHELLSFKKNRKGKLTGKFNPDIRRGSYGYLSYFLFNDINITDKNEIRGFYKALKLKGSLFNYWFPKQKIKFSLKKEDNNNVLYFNIKEMVPLDGDEGVEKFEVYPTAKYQCIKV